ncbi:MAG: hypothetical protein GEU75_01145 [Dehalococcoidia bacterium]|nr:hypothetical protein [Dehalococcoidia bacterium]
MKIDYEDAFEESLAALRQGATIDAAVSRHPEHAARLREDLALVAASQELHDSLPEPAGDRALARLQRDLGTARAGRLAQAPPRRIAFWRSLFPAAALAGSIALVAFIALGFFGGAGGPDEAAAAMLEGIVLENVDGRLTLQTADGIEAVTIASDAAAQDDTGSPLDTSAIEAGQMLLVRGERLAAGGVLAARLELRAEAATRRWCAENPIVCREVDRLLRQYADRCQDGAPACERIRRRIQDLTQDLPQITLLEEIRNRCEQADNAACVDLRDFCDRQPGICEAARDGIIKRAADGDVQRLRALSQSCLAGEALACRQLRQACQDQGLACPTPVIERPTSTPPTTRPLLQPTPSRPATGAPTTTPPSRLAQPSPTPTIPTRNPPR